MESVQHRALVAASIIWHRLQPGVTFVLQDGWLRTARTLLTLPHWWASRRGYAVRGVPSRKRMRKWFLFSIYLLNLTFMSEIETYTLWKLTYKESRPRNIEFAQATAEIPPWKIWKMPPPPQSCEGAAMHPSQIPTVPSPLISKRTWRPWAWHNS